MTAQEAYILAKAYTKKSIEGAGSLKGAACQIKSIEAITGGHRITFEWEDNDGEVSTDTMDVMDGADGNDGVGISSITYKETDAHGNYVYTVTLTDTNTYDIICPKGAQGETGATGATGNGIASIVKTSTAGLVDTYTITYTNGQTTTFTVTNGESITVDSAMSGSSTNPVQNKVITEALADKQDAEDNNLTTEAKTIVGAINEHEGDISSLKSGLTTLDNEVNGDATTYPYADVITIPDAIPANIADCSVKIEPVQDLHGYDKPWVGGAGKNKYSTTAGADAWKDNTASHTNDNGTLVITYSANLSTPGVYADSGNVIRGLINGASSDMTVSFSAYATTENKFYIGAGNSPKGITIKTTPERFFVTFSAGYSGGFIIYQQDDNKTANTVYISDVQVETGSTASSYEPYTNVCPISGHTEASVEVTDGDETTNTYTIALGDTIYKGLLDVDTGLMTPTHAVVDMGTLSWTKIADGLYKAEQSGMKNTGDDEIADMLCETYFPDMYSILPAGSIALRYTNQIWVRDNTVADATELTTNLDGKKLCYPLGTPTTIQLTPQQIQLLKGTNTLTASTGQISVTVNGVSGAIGAVQEQVNATDAALAELADKLPTAPTTDGAYVLTVTVADGTPTYSWESAS